MESGLSEMSVDYREERKKDREALWEKEETIKDR